MKLVSQDADGLRAALLEILEEGFRADTVKRSLRNVGNDPVRRARVLAGIPARTLAPGYYVFAGYIFWLDDLRRSQIEIQRMSRDESEGLRLLGSARSEFEWKHPACHACGLRQEIRVAPECRGCKTKFVQRQAA